MNIDIDKVDFNMLIDSLSEDELELLGLIKVMQPAIKFATEGFKLLPGEAIRTRKLARGHRLIRKTLMLGKSS